MYFVQLPSLWLLRFAFARLKYIRTISLLSPGPVYSPDHQHQHQHQLQPSAVQTHSHQPTTSSIYQSFSSSLLLHNCIAASLALFDQPLTRDAASSAVSHQHQASKLQQQQTQPKCLLSDLLTFLPARAPRPADLCLLCPNESCRLEEQIQHPHNGYSSPWLSSSLRQWFPRI
ncbi:hypothetical protein M440DRAFT_1447036 [Trichoderma longibrachiatum ATCC 18648]|uniref:Uncharacterized protein n=1 Tax=Trichoderma longibrachiatum ATCC 18648 TaxID=983965 RepID=A0A2T4BW18_TRILO|nr:hypothetical protein M440DRAFT_1447036 [Trichoderma longibrachiatum ATCC 18648]